MKHYASYLAHFAVVLSMAAGCGGPTEQDGDAAADAPADLDGPPPAVAAGNNGEPTLAELVRRDPQFESLRAALEAAELMPLVESGGPWTVFAPTNEAFAALPEAFSLAVLMQPDNRALLATILRYHLVEGAIGAQDLAEGPAALGTAGGAPLPVSASGPVIEVGARPNTAVIIRADIASQDSIMHAIDRVLLPPAD